jgi:antitoxin component YwqK of YwqJK toxin-antitoxin module
MYKHGKRNGKAVEETKDRKRFEGSYLDDRRDGEFVEKDSNGKITAKGRYINGRRVVD